MTDINQVRQILMNELGLTRQSIRQLTEEIVLQTVNKKLQELDLDRKIQQSIDNHLGQALRGYRGSAEHLRREVVERISAAIAQKIRENVIVQFSDPVEEQDPHG